MYPTNPINLIISLFFCCSGFLTAQDISATVTDENGTPIAYATVYLPSKATGVLTDEIGLFTLKLEDSPATDTIQFSCIGYLTTYVTVGQLRQLPAPRRLPLESANYVLSTAEVTEERIKMEQEKVRLPGIMNGTYIYPTGRTPWPVETGTILRPRRAGKLQEVIINLRQMEADSVLLNINVYDFTFGMVGAPLLKERVFVKVGKEDIKQDIILDLRDQGIEVGKKFLVSMQLLKVVGSLGEISLSAKAADGFGFYRKPGGRWEKLYLVPNIQALVVYPK
jgi:hypothetical protein